MYYIIEPPQAIQAAMRAGSVTVREHGVTYNAGAWLVLVSKRPEAPLSDLEVTAFATVDSSETLARAQLVSFTLRSALGRKSLGLQELWACCQRAARRGLFDSLSNNSIEETVQDLCGIPSRLFDNSGKGVTPPHTGWMTEARNVMVPSCGGRSVRGQPTSAAVSRSDSAIPAGCRCLSVVWIGSVARLARHRPCSIR
jgi:hypothetical protein